LGKVHLWQQALDWFYNILKSINKSPKRNTPT
jgi:hypothetical protein